MKEYQNASQIFNTHAELYQIKYMDVSRYAIGIQSFLVGMKQNAHVLDLACGPGNLTSMMHEFRPDLNLFGIDLAPDMIKLATKNLPIADFEVMDVLDIDQLTQKFDGIVAGFVLPYLSKEECLELIEKSAKRLHPCGKLYLSCIHDTHAKSGKTEGSTGESIYQYFYETKDLADMLSPSGFEVVYDNVILYEDDKGQKVSELELVVSENIP